MRCLYLLLLIVVAAPAIADDDCDVPVSAWQTREAVQALAAERGWSVRRIKMDDGCYEIHGRDSAGRSIEVKVDPETLEILEEEPEADDESQRDQDAE